MYVNSGSVFAIGLIFPILGSLAVAGRFTSRVKHGTGFAVDDWLCLPALAIVIGTGAVMVYGSVHNAIGHDMYSELPPPQLLEELEFVIDAMNPVGTGLIRLSFLFFYRRIFRGRTFNITSWIMVGLVVSWILAFTIATFAQCRTNLWAMWTSFPAMGQYCIKTIALLGLMGITSFILDVAILAMPFFWIWHLHMPTSQKWAVTSVFLCGGFTICAGAIRMAAGITALTFQPNVPQDILGLKGMNHVNGGTSIWLFWQYVEHGTGLVVCCMPALKGFYNWVGTSLRSVASSSLTSTPSFRWMSRYRHGSKQSSHKELIKEKTFDSQTGSYAGSEDDRQCPHITVTKTVDQYREPLEQV